MYVQVLGTEPLSFLVWTPSGAIQVLARFTVGELLLGLLLTLVLAVQIWSWWSDRFDGWMERQGW